MFQRAARQHDHAVRQAPHPDHHVASAVGKATLLSQVAPHVGPADLRIIGVETAQREIRAIRVTLLPGLIKALRSKEPALAKRIEVSEAGMKLRYMLMRVNTQVCELEKTSTFVDPMVIFLRKEVATLAARAARLGAYHGREHLIPRAYEDPTKRRQPLEARVAAAKTDQDYAPINPRALRVTSLTRRRFPRFDPVSVVPAVPATRAASSR